MSDGDMSDQGISENNDSIDVCEELVKFTWLTRGRSAYLIDRYSERVESAEELSRRVNQSTH